MNPGVKAAARKIPLGRPFFDEREQEAVRRVLATEWILNGPEVRAFEGAFRSYVGAARASGVSSCTAGMHLALSALGVGREDEVLLPAFNFIAAGLAVLQAGARPVFVEVDTATGNLDLKDLERRITDKTKAILALHYAGFPAPMAEIMAVAGARGLKVVEDAAHALGSSYGGRKIGAWGDATAFSFGPLKMICTGMGGMVTSNDAGLIEKVNSLRSYGMDKSMWDRREALRPWSYSVGDLGHNFRMTDVAAAMGIVQMDKLESFVETRRRLVARYDEGLGGLGRFEFFTVPRGAAVAPLYYAVKTAGGWRDDLALFLIERGIGASVHWDPPLHLHPLFGPFGFRAGDLPCTERLAKEVISLPLHPAMTDEDADYVIGAVREFFSRRRA